MPVIAGGGRYQVAMVALDDMVAADSDARLIDRFVDHLDIAGLGFKPPKEKGRPCYGAARLPELYVWGYRKGVRSSRRLEEACATNVEVMWMTDDARPDFRTIADFRKENADKLKGVFRAFNDRLSGRVERGFESVDGTKIRASNSKTANFTAHKLDDRIKWGNGRIEEYMRVIERVDAMDDPGEDDLVTKSIVEDKLKELSERMELYEGYRKLLEQSGESQISLTDADARLMKEKNGFIVAYNPQTAVDSNTHIIRDFEMTNAPTDHGQLLPTLKGIADSTDGVVEATADMGYQSVEDMVACLEEGVVPHVICGDGKDGYDLEVDYREPAAGPDPTSTRAADLSACIHAGVVPDAYAHAIEGMQVVETRKKVVDEPARQDPRDLGTREEMEARAKEGYFVRDPKANLVICPAGETHRQKSVKKDGKIRYANKTACRRCPSRNQCLTGKQEWKELDFSKDELEKACKPWHKANGTEPDARGVTKGKYHYERRTVVRFRLKPDLAKTTLRMGLSEHPFGHIKRNAGEDHFLLRGKVKVEGEFALMALGYNMARAKNLLGFDALMEAMAA